MVCMPGARTCPGRCSTATLGGCPSTRWVKEPCASVEAFHSSVTVVVTLCRLPSVAAGASSAVTVMCWLPPAGSAGTLNCQESPDEQSAHVAPDTVW